MAAEISRSQERPVPLRMRVRGPWAFFADLEGSPWSLPWPEESTARAWLEAVLWKPRMHLEVRALTLLAPIRYIRVPCPEDAPPLGLQRGQRIGALQGVDYLVEGELSLNSAVPPRGGSDNHGKYAAMFQRRLGQGRPHQQAFLGIRGFAAELLAVTGEERPWAVDVDWGWMRGDWGRGEVWAAAVEGRVTYLRAPGESPLNR